MIGPFFREHVRRFRLAPGVAVTLLFLLALPHPAAALPPRLVLALDGVAYRDLQALQAGVSRTNFWGRVYQLRAFTADEGYYPVSRMISTFPSASDVAWTDIFGNRPLPGYQRTYFSKAANSLIELNGVTTTVEHERQMDWQVQNGFLRAMGYLCPAHTLKYETRGLEIYFGRSGSLDRNFYAYFRATDDAQHLDRDILALLCELDGHLQKLRADYRTRTGRDLEIVILSDHGHNHAGRGIRVKDNAFLERLGYRVATRIEATNDVVLPVVGIESWVEVHCHPAVTERLANQLCQLEGVDVLTAPVPGETNRYMVLNARGERADILWHPAVNAFAYVTVSGDPLGYAPVIAAMKQGRHLDAEGFASADSWMAATMTNRYPLAPERIVRGHTHATLNPATILVSLDNRYVNDVWFTEKGSRLVTCRSTHGGLDDLCSDGILLSNFKPTQDTSTARVAEQFQDFPSVKDFRAEEPGAELVTKSAQAMVRIPRDPFDREYQQLPGDGSFLRVWSPHFGKSAERNSVTVTIEKVKRYSTSPPPRQFVLSEPLVASDGVSDERVYALPADLQLAPGGQYNLWVRLAGTPKSERPFGFSFYTDAAGKPCPF